MARISLKDPPEVFVSTAAMSAAVSRAVAKGKLRRLGSRLYTTNRSEDAASLVRRHLWEIAAGFFPAGLSPTVPPSNTNRRRMGPSSSSHRRAETSSYRE